MPKFTFECDCGLTFTRTLKMGEPKTFECPSCKEEANRVWEGFGFNFAEGGSAPANSGVTKHDYPTADQAVGSSADKRWAEHTEREKVKSKVREVSGDRALIRKTSKDYIEYTAGGPKVVETRKELAKELTEIYSRPPV